MSAPLNVDDFLEEVRRREHKQHRLTAERDFALIKQHPAAVRRFRRALRRIEGVLRHVAPTLKGTLFDVEEARRYLGTCYGRHRRTGLDEAACWFAAVATADRTRGSAAGDAQADAFERVARHIQRLAHVTKAPVTPEMVYAPEKTR